MFQARAARRLGIIYAVLLGASLAFMAVSGSPVVREFQHGIGFAFRPIQGAVDGLAQGLGSILTSIGEIDRLRLENVALRNENERLQNDNRAVAELRHENELLTGLLQLRSGYEYETRSATVIARESSEFRRLITLDRGTDDGVVIGDVVIGEGGALAGRVVEAGGNFSKVLLITDTGSTVIGQLSTNAATGEVVGQLGGVLIMDKIDATAQINLGEEVVTAGIELGGGIRSPYPKGLVIGQVVDVSRDANEVVQTAFLDPAANLDRLEFVLVIIDYRGGLPGPGQGAVDCTPGEDGTLPDTEQPCASPTARPLPTPTSRP